MGSGDRWCVAWVVRVVRCWIVRGAVSLVSMSSFAVARGSGSEEVPWF